MEGQQKKYRPRQKLWVIYGYEGATDMTSFDTWKQYRDWRKETNCTVRKLVRGTERDPDVGRKSKGA